MRRFLMALPIALTIFLGTTLPAYAANSVNLPILNPNFSVVPAACINCPCTFGEVLQLAQNLINAAIAIGIIAAVLVMVYAGVMFMVNPTKPEVRSQARSMFINVVIGLVIVLAAWLVVDFIMKTIYGGTASYGPWNSILADTVDEGPCIVAKTIVPFANPVGAIAQSLLTGTNPNQQNVPPGQPAPTAGKCVPISAPSNPCSVSNLQNTCLASNANLFSGICDRESGGSAAASLNANINTDVTADGHPYSIGIFATNLTNKPDPYGLGCYKAFSTYCGHGTVSNSHGHLGYCTATVINLPLYNQCVAAASNSQTNIQAACTLSRNGTNLQPWIADGPKCGF